ncbi:MAG: ATP-NAD kinase family protein [Candidatus Bathyarchaeia archaeon]
MRIGFIVNPIAGMGGRVGLKGTDGADALKKAVARGAKPWSQSRAKQTLMELVGMKGDLEFLTWSGEMGEELLKSLGFEYKVLGEIGGAVSTAEDTRAAAERMAEEDAKLILFAGGDGTVVDIVESVDAKIPLLGIPAGVKMFSGVFASTPIAAAQVLVGFLKGEANLVEREVMDVDEDAYRSGRLSASLKGYAITPVVQNLVLSEKSVVQADEEAMKEAIATRIMESMRRDATYILGPGSTVAKVAELIGVEKTLLGVDVVRGLKLVAKDADEKAILKSLKNEAWIILSPLGGQGSLLGRGNQQISPTVLRRVGLDRIIIIATPSKLQCLKYLTVDTGDPELDSLLKGYRRVIIGRHEEKVLRVV